MTRRLIVTGSNLRPRDAAAKARIARGLHTHVWPLLDKGTIRPLIHTTFALDEAGSAQSAMEAGTHSGKIILRVAAD